MWLIKAKRFDFSYEPGLSGEPVSNQVYDDTFAGRIAGGSNPTTETKSYDDTVDDASESVFDYSLYGNNDDVYASKKMELKVLLKRHMAVQLLKKRQNQKNSKKFVLIGHESSPRIQI